MLTVMLSFVFCLQTLTCDSVLEATLQLPETLRIFVKQVHINIHYLVYIKYFRKDKYILVFAKEIHLSSST